MWQAVRNVSKLCALNRLHPKEIKDLLVELIEAEEDSLAEFLAEEADEFPWYHSTDFLKCFKRFHSYFPVLVAVLILFPIFLKDYYKQN